jgi:hypothetical protein
MPKFKFEAHKLESILKEYAEIRQVEIPQAVLINGRLLAKELARRTQPFGTKPDAGMQRVRNDIGKVIKEEAKLEEMIDKVSDDRIAARLKQLWNARRFDVLEIVFRNIGFLNKYGDMQFITDFKGPHRANRDPRTRLMRSISPPATLADMLRKSPSGLGFQRQDGLWRLKPCPPPWQTSAAATISRSL